MVLNATISTQSTQGERLLYEDLIIESLQMYGQDIYYLPRKTISIDKILNEDRSEFNKAFQIEMYLANTDGFDGDGDLLSKFGLEIRDQATFVVSRRRFSEEVDKMNDSLNTIKVTIDDESLFDTVGKTPDKYIFKAGDIISFKKSGTINFTAEIKSIDINSKTLEIINITQLNATINWPDRSYILVAANGISETVITSFPTLKPEHDSKRLLRPLEGDLIYLPLSKSLFEIRFVEHENPFYQLKNLPTFELRCELYEYNQEEFNTGNNDIDKYDDFDDIDKDGIDDNDKWAENNELEESAKEILDFSEKNPFGDEF